MFLFRRVYWITRTPAFVWVGLGCIICWTVSSIPDQCAVKPNSKIPPKIKNREIDWSMIMFMLALVWQTLNVKHMQSTDTERLYTYLLKVVFKTKSWIHIKWIIFWRILSIWNHCVLPCTLISQFFIYNWDGKNNLFKYCIWLNFFAAMHLLISAYLVHVYMSPLFLKLSSI